MKKQITEASKFLSYVLRHKPESIELPITPEGWVNLQDLISKGNASGQHLTMELIDQVVQTSDKKRFEISEDGNLIRAAQGHSTDKVNITYEAKVPPDILYHGTTERFIDGIFEKGLMPMSRHHVHLSQDVSTAETVGARHGSPVVLKIDANAMHVQGHQFYQASNGVWLTAAVPVEFFKW